MPRTGMPGWKYFAEPILESLDPTLCPSKSGHAVSDEDIEFVGPRKVLVGSERIVKSLEKLNKLLTSHPHPSLTKRLLRPILMPLWSFASWQDGGEFIERSYRQPARSLLKILLQLSSNNNRSSNSEMLTLIVGNILFNGRPLSSKLRWAYSMSKDKRIQIEKRDAAEANESNAFISDLSSADDKIASFSTLIESIPEFDTEISHLFIHLCKRWLKDNKTNGDRSIITRIELRESEDSSKERYIEAKLMQNMMTSVPEKLVSDSRQVLDLVNQILARFKGSESLDAHAEETISVALSLLNLILTSPKAMTTPDVEEVFDEIRRSVHLIGNNSPTDISLTAQNLLSLIDFRTTLIDSDISTADALKDQPYEDRKNLSLAMSYLTSTDSPPPVRVQGLELISTLYQSHSPVLDIPALVVLLSSLIQDSDEYIYLRVIKSFIELSNRHPQTILRDLIDRYVDANEEAELDQRLRFGEALLQVINNIGSAFSGDIARTTCEGLMSIAGRRGIRPKSQQEQENKARLQQQQNKEAEEAWDGPPPQLDEYLPSEFEEQDELLSQIVSGWESKRGSEDVRIRASALSILGSAIESHVTVIGATVISTVVDMSIHILTLEPEPAKGILRRSAIILVMNFIRALDLAREQGTKVGFGFVGKSLDDMRRVLQYVEGTDNDSVVRQHAKDVLDGLQAFEFNALLPTQQSPQLEIREIAGLTLNPGGIRDSNAKTRPRIEEIE